MSNFHLALAFFLQVAVILAVCRAVGAGAGAIGQPRAVGEMIAGVLLGPSLLGWLAPQVSAWLFPPAAMPVLYVVAQVGLVLYMFTTGLEFRIDLAASRARTAASISVAGMVVPFALGAALALSIHGGGALFAEGLGRGTAMVYLGAAMSITAFPMLARIIHERGLTGTTVGTLALTAGSIDDAAAWCVLAVVLAQLGGHWSIAVLAPVGGAAYAAFVLLALRPLLARILRVESTGELGPARFAWVLVMLMLGAWLTDRIGIYAVFGAFVLGVAMPRGPVCRALSRSIEPLTTGLLLPLFFVYAGLNTRIGLLDRPVLWALAGVVIGAACLGKGVACWGAARIHGESGRDAVAIGALMNARGLMELIILTIGLESGIITPTLFSIMVLMAIVTTLLATPVVLLALGRGQPGTRATRATTGLPRAGDPLRRPENLVE